MMISGKKIMLGVSGSIEDEDGTDANSLTGVVAAPPLFDPARVAAGDLSGGTLVGVAPGLHSLPIISPAPPYPDVLATLRIDCQ